MSFDAQLLELGDALRREGVAIGTSELMDGFAALREVGWTEPATFREALAATLVKSPEDRRVFDLVFERFMFRAAEQAALHQDVREGEGSDAAGGQMEADGEGAGDGQGDGEGGELDFEALRALVEEAIRNDDESAMRDLARLASAAKASLSSEVPTATPSARSASPSSSTRASNPAGALTKRSRRRRRA